MEKMYVIISIKHSTEKEACFWRSDNAGYTTNPWAAGLYTQQQVESDPSYYNDGYNALAVCINNSSLPNSGLNFSIKPTQLKKYREQNRGQLTINQQPVTSN